MKACYLRPLTVNSNGDPKVGLYDKQYSQYSKATFALYSQQEARKFETALPKKSIIFDYLSVFDGKAAVNPI